MGGGGGMSSRMVTNKNMRFEILRSRHLPIRITEVRQLLATPGRVARGAGLWLQGFGPGSGSSNIEFLHCSLARVTGRGVQTFALNRGAPFVRASRMQSRSLPNQAHRSPFFEFSSGLSGAYWLKWLGFKPTSETGSRHNIGILRLCSRRS